MNLTLSTKTNRAALAFVVGVLPKQTNLPVLSQIRLGGNEDEVSICATNLDVTLAALLTPSRTGDVKPCLLPGRKLADLFKRGEWLGIESNCAKAAITLDGNAFSLSQMPVVEFPPLPNVDPDYTFTIPAEVLSTAVHRVEEAVSNDESRYVLTGSSSISRQPRFKS